MIFTAFVSASFSWAQSCPLCASLVVKVDNIKKKGGILRIMLTKDKITFEELDPDKIEPSKIYFKNSVVTAHEVIFEFPEIPAGRYAFKVFQDLNSNELLDTSLLGKPLEPFAMSKAEKYDSKKVLFEEASFELKPRKRHVLKSRLFDFVKN